MKKSLNLSKCFSSNNPISYSKDRLNSHNIDWNYISYYMKLSEDFIRAFSDKVKWYAISIRQTLSEDFIREFGDDVYWQYISCYQILSEGFIREFKHKGAFYSVIKKNCGNSNRTLFIKEYGKITIGCFVGTEKEAIAAIKDKYKNNQTAGSIYIDDVKDLFKEMRANKHRF